MNSAIIDPLDTRSIHAALTPLVATRLPALIILPEVDSTNQYLLTHPELASGTVCLAEAQLAGRGRRGRVWQSPAGGNIYYSMSWDFLVLPARISGLSLAVGVAVAELLQNLGIDGIGLKWPNDVFCLGRKLVGILLETVALANGTFRVVIGVGVNVSLSHEQLASVDQPCIDLLTLLGARPNRNKLVAAMINRCYETIDYFQQQGLASFISRWQEYDIFVGQKIILKSAAGDVEGQYQGIDECGNLLLQSEQGLQAFNSGEVSARILTT